MRRGSLYYGGQAVGILAGAVVALLGLCLLLLAGLLAMAATLGLWAVFAAGVGLSWLAEAAVCLGGHMGRPWGWWRLNWETLWDALPEILGSRPAEAPRADAAPEYGLCHGCERTTIVVPNPVGGLYVCSECGSERVAFVRRRGAAVLTRVTGAGVH